MVVHSKVELKLNNVIALSSLQSWNICSRITNIRVIYCMCSKCCQLLMAQVAKCVEAKENVCPKYPSPKNSHHDIAWLLKWVDMKHVVSQTSMITF